VFEGRPAQGVELTHRRRIHGTGLAQTFRRLVCGTRDGLPRQPPLPPSVLSPQALWLNGAERTQQSHLSMATGSGHLDPTGYLDIKIGCPRTGRRQVPQRARHDGPRARFSDR
jgi:hypothetical protein